MCLFVVLYKHRAKGGYIKGRRKDRYLKINQNYMSNILRRSALTFGVVLTMIGVAAIPNQTSANILDSGTDLGDLIILDQLMDGGLIEEGVGSDSKLGNLIILDELFNDSIFGDDNNLGDLFVLDRLFKDGMLNDNGDLGNLIILDELFGNRGL